MRADRSFTELVPELRVAQTGVQILFAFLLSLGFLDRFPRDNRRFDVPTATRYELSAEVRNLPVARGNSYPGGELRRIGHATARLAAAGR